MSASEDERRARLAAALKQNISRRKAQSRAREGAQVGQYDFAATETANVQQVDSIEDSDGN